MASVTLQITGMSCGHCVSSVQKALDSLDGVTVESVVIGRAQVSIDPARASVERVVSAVEDAGYEARPAEAAR